MYSYTLDVNVSGNMKLCRLVVGCMLTGWSSRSQCNGPSGTLHLHACTSTSALAARLGHSALADVRFASLATAQKLPHPGQLELPWPDLRVRVAGGGGTGTCAGQGGDPKDVRLCALEGSQRSNAAIARSCS
ncbi:uncharacterized protein Triagg1_4938 [Trichoderma aggressivum f. europaeum]|uniref:Uncharacterized protein n=1 Tax=Trichoderma aggressivum f. europaeum TaxID=173218 RepID=A0AAE1J6Y0_9HYPO|nr:hypothetical protein Triagg1_4938 [Trichoderma aggressivum f. europaeum]